MFCDELVRKELIKEMQFKLIKTVASNRLLYVEPSQTYLELMEGANFSKKSAR